jgi:hypothetical protein
MKRWTLVVVSANIVLAVVLARCEVDRQRFISLCAAAHARWGLVWSPAWTRCAATRSTLASVAAILGVEHLAGSLQRALPPQDGHEFERYQTARDAPSWIFRDHQWRRLTGTPDLGTREFARRHVALLRSSLAQEDYWRFAQEAISEPAWPEFSQHGDFFGWIDRVKSRREHLMAVLGALDTAPMEQSTDPAPLARYRLDPPVAGTREVDLLQAAEGAGIEQWIVER